jgi:ice-binding like protein
VNQNANPNLWNLPVAFVMMSLAAGCGSVGSTTQNDGGPNDARSASGGNGGGGGRGTGGGNAGGTNTAGTSGSGIDGGSTGGTNTAGTSGSGIDGGSTGGINSAAETPVNLRTAGDYVILAESAISTVAPAVVTGDLGIYPMAASFITGFSLIADSTNVFSTSLQVTGKIYAADYAPPTSSNLSTAIGDMSLAYTDAAGRPPDVTELGAGNIGGMTLAPGVYQWGTPLLLPTDLTLNGTSTAVWVFQIAQTLTLSSAVKVHLTGGALAKNVFWQVAGSVELGTTSHIEGIILCSTMINLRTGSSILGRLLAQTAVTLDTSTVTQP